MSSTDTVTWYLQVMQIYQMDAMNFHFVAHPNAWVVHRPHAPSSGYNHTFTGEAYTLKHKPTDHLWKMERIAKVRLPRRVCLSNAYEKSPNVAAAPIHV